MAPTSRKRTRRRAAAAAMGLGCFTATVASAAPLNGPSHRVTPDDAPRRQMEGRRRVEREYYRDLYQEQRRRDEGGDLGESSEEADTARGDRRLYSPGSHKKKNDVSGGTFAVLGGNNNGGGSSKGAGTPENSHDPAKTFATDLSKFARIGGNGYELPAAKRHPYMASLQLEGHAPSTGEPYDVHMCTGFLVAPDFVMTAAHCATFVPPGETKAVPAFNGIEVGKVDLSDEGVAFDPYDSETYDLYYENLVPEENFRATGYDGETYRHDLMLVKAYGVSRFPPVRVEKQWPEVWERVTALGWGAENDSSSKRYSDRLRSAELEVMSNAECKAIDVHVVDPYTLESDVLSLDDHVYDDMTCARSTERYICHGDPGGPAIVEGENSDGDRAYGVLSWGYGCVNRDYPAVMANIPDHYQWIRNTICRHSTDPPDWFNCPRPMSALSSGRTTRVTLRLKLDRMAVETGFVIETLENQEIVAQRQTGHYRNEIHGNEIVLESMDLPANTCYRLIMLDSFGDGHCCNMGGGPAILYKGSDTSHYTGKALVEISGTFEFVASDTFCLGTATANNNLQSMSGGHQKNPPPAPQGQHVSVPKPRPQSSNPPGPSPPRDPPQGTSQGIPVGQGNSKPAQPVVIPSNAQDPTGAKWSGPNTTPEFAYCSQFCASASHGTACGDHQCMITDDSDATSDAAVQEIPTLDTQFYDEGSEYFLTVRFQFDDRPEEVSWVLYDLSINEAVVFVDFDAYNGAERKNQLLDVKVTMDGPEWGEKQYAFTVYDNASNGLCCEHGNGYYKVFLGDVADDLELLGDDEFEFSSSYYFTLFEGQEGDYDTYSPTASPSDRPTPGPSRGPTREPTPPPSNSPSLSPTTERPTEVWEKRRSEDADDIGARWSMRKNTPPGVFNDVGGDQMKFRFEASRVQSSARDNKARARWASLLVCSLALAFMH
ncbi:hypothetical protein ACHAXT_010211 [Thalassiosira profunda]